MLLIYTKLLIISNKRPCVKLITFGKALYLRIQNNLLCGHKHTHIFWGLVMDGSTVHCQVYTFEYIKPVRWVQDFEMYQECDQILKCTESVITYWNVPRVWSHWNVPKVWSHIEMYRECDHILKCTKSLIILKCTKSVFFIFHLCRLK